MLSWQQILHEQWHAAEALQNCIHVAEVAHVSAQPVLTARKSHSTELAASLLLQHNTFLLGHRKHRIQALIIKSDLLRRNTVFSHEDSREDCTNWCQWEMAEVRLFIQTYGRAELRLWQRLENDKMQENKIQNAKQSLQQEICCSTAARAGRKLPAACHYLKWMLLFSVNSVFVQTQRRLPLTAHLLKGERQKFQSQKTNCHLSWHQSFLLEGIFQLLPLQTNTSMPPHRSNAFLGRHIYSCFLLARKRRLYVKVAIVFSSVYTEVSHLILAVTSVS